MVSAVMVRLRFHDEPPWCHCESSWHQGDSLGGHCEPPRLQGEPSLPYDEVQGTMASLTEPSSAPWVPITHARALVSKKAGYNNRSFSSTATLVIIAT